MPAKPKNKQAGFVPFDQARANDLIYNGTVGYTCHTGYLSKPAAYAAKRYLEKLGVE